MIPVLPGSRSGFQGCDLPSPSEFLLGCVTEKAASLPSADQLVDLLHQLLGENYMSALGVHDWSHSNVNRQCEMYAKLGQIGELFVRQVTAQPFQFAHEIGVYLSLLVFAEQF
jgi:hypothetical protein